MLHIGRSKKISNIAIIIAGRSGSRMGQDIPKQVIDVYDKQVTSTSGTYPGKPVKTETKK